MQWTTTRMRFSGNISLSRINQLPKSSRPPTRVHHMRTVGSTRWTSSVITPAILTLSSRPPQWAPWLCLSPTTAQIYPLWTIRVKTKRSVWLMRLPRTVAARHSTWTVALQTLDTVISPMTHKARASAATSPSRACHRITLSSQTQIWRQALTSTKIIKRSSSCRYRNSKRVHKLGQQWQGPLTRLRSAKTARPQAATHSVTWCTINGTVSSPSIRV